MLTNPVTRKLVILCHGFLVLVIAFALTAWHFKLSVDVPIAISFILLLAPYWAFGFGIEQLLCRHASPLAPLLLLLPYLIFAVPTHHFLWTMCLGMAALVLFISLLLHHAHVASPGHPDWHDAIVLALLGFSVEFHLFDKAWPVGGLSGMPKLLFLDAALYGYLVLRPIGGIGFDFRAKLSDLGIGLREFLYYTPVAIAIGFLLQFLHLHKTLSSPLAFAAGWLFTLFFVAMPEELFFRGLMLNMLERRIDTNRALAVTSVVFGLAHFNKRTQYFNWRYVILAAIAGVFYGRAWLARRRLLASAITHTTVDTVWSIWLR
jgi:membrane protease YdiL (CAAX protease family)